MAKGQRMMNQDIEEYHEHRRRTVMTLMIWTGLQVHRKRNEGQQ